MEDFELVHKPCGKPAKLRFWVEQTWIEGDELFEEETNNNRLSLDCSTCGTSTEIYPR